MSAILSCHLFHTVLEAPLKKRVLLKKNNTVKERNAFSSEFLVAEKVALLQVNVLHREC